jgi:chemotaxis protein MotB
MAKLPPKEFEEDKEDWLTTYADAITLLMAFFVMLLSFTKYDIPAFDEAAAAIKTNIGKQQTTSPIQLLKIEVQDLVYNMQADQVVKVDKDDKGVVIDLSGSAFYLPGSAELRDEATPVLEKLALALKAPIYLPYVIEVEGHTDDDPINTPAIRSNWELSALRATRVVRLFNELGIDAVRMRAAGLSDTRPKAPNRDAQGNAIKENQALNRRVSVRVYPMSLDQRKAYLESVDKKQAARKAAGGESATTAAPATQPADAPQGQLPLPAPAPGAPPPTQTDPPRQ